MAGLKIVAFVLTAGFLWTLYLFAHSPIDPCPPDDCKKSSVGDPQLRGTTQ